GKITKDCFPKGRPGLQERNVWTSTVFSANSLRVSSTLPLDWLDGHGEVLEAQSRRSGSPASEVGGAWLWAAGTRSARRASWRWRRGPAGGAGGRGGLGERRAVTAARRGGAKRPPAESHGERPWRGARISAPVHSSAPARRPGAHPAAAPAHPEPLTAARYERDAPRERPRAGGRRGRERWGARAPRRTPPQERRVGGRAEEGGGGAPAEPVACAPVPPGRLLRREPEPPGGRDSAEDNEEEAARRAERPGSPAPEAPGITPATGPRFVRLSRVWREEASMHMENQRIFERWLQGHSKPEQIDELAWSTDWGYLKNAAVSPGDWDSCSGQGHTAVAEGGDEIARGAMAEILLLWVLRENPTADKVLTVDKSLNF
ncbi:hypothetical protein EI555_017353, partial [Monodon monoceros]